MTDNKNVSIHTLQWDQEMRRHNNNTKRRNAPTRPQYQSLEARNLLAAITVTTLADNVDGTDGLISLREAIIATNTNAAFGDAPAGDVTGDSIRIAPALIGQTFTLTERDLEITDDLVIQGFDSTLQSVSGRIFSINTSEAVTLSRLSLVGGRSAEGGAVRFEGGGTLRVFRSQFVDNSAQAGGAIFAAGGNVFIFESTFSNNSSLNPVFTGDLVPSTVDGAGNGGALFLADQSATVVILGSTFDGNFTEPGDGGAIFGGQSDQIFVFAETNFTNNRALHNGGAISSEGLIRIGQSTFTDNFALQGGAIFAAGDRLTVGNTSFDNNFAEFNGGAVGIATNVIAQFNNASFTNNEAGGERVNRSNSFGRGGAISVQGLDFNNPLFSIPDDEPLSRLIIRSSSFEGNRSQQGGAISNGGDILVISDSFFGDNVVADNTLTVESNGGAIFNGPTFRSRGRIEVFGTTFENNEASNDFIGANGGAIFSNGTDTEIAFSTFTLNQAELGGAVSVREADLNVFESDFVQNRAGFPVADPRFTPIDQAFNGGDFITQDGGAILFNPLPSQSLRITGGLFENNVANGSGGAVENFGDLRDFGSGTSQVFINPSPNGPTRFIGNRALILDGGAISSLGDTRIRDAVFSENTARNGGGIFSTAGFLSLSGAQISDNDARINGGGVFLASDATLLNDSSVISGNTATGDDNLFAEI